MSLTSVLHGVGTQFSEVANSALVVLCNRIMYKHLKHLPFSDKMCYLTIA